MSTAYAYSSLEYDTYRSSSATVGSSYSSRGSHYPARRAAQPLSSARRRHSGPAHHYSYAIHSTNTAHAALTVSKPVVFAPRSIYSSQALQAPQPARVSKPMPVRRASRSVSLQAPQAISRTPRKRSRIFSGGTGLFSWLRDLLTHSSFGRTYSSSGVCVWTGSRW